jgi:hypothetical protein
VFKKSSLISSFGFFIILVWNLVEKSQEMLFLFQVEEWRRLFREGHSFTKTANAHYLLLLRVFERQMKLT